MSNLDLSIQVHDRRAGTPTGPAPGTITGTPDGIFQCWQHGARVFEIRADHSAAAAAAIPRIQKAGSTDDCVFDLNIGASIPPDFATYRHLFHCATIYCLHEGPAERIEATVRALEMPVSLKLSPVLLGNELEELLPDDYEIAPEAFDNEISLPEARDLVNRLQATVKLCNTLEVRNRETGEIMYLSGAGLHPIALRLAEHWPDRPTGLSAGVNAGTFADCVARGFVPVTACTDLLKHGPAQFRVYLQNLEEQMQQLGVTHIPDFIRACPPIPPPPVPPLTPRRIGRHLWLSDWADV